MWTKCRCAQGSFSPQEVRIDTKENLQLDGARLGYLVYFLSVGYGSNTDRKCYFLLLMAPSTKKEACWASPTYLAWQEHAMGMRMKSCILEPGECFSEHCHRAQSKNVPLTKVEQVREGSGVFFFLFFLLFRFLPVVVREVPKQLRDSLRQALL